MLCTLGVMGLAAAYLLYPLTFDPISFAMVQIMVGVCGGIATTTNMAMFMDMVPRGADRPRAMAFFAGALAGGHTVGNLVGGFSGDLMGYDDAFRIGALMTAGSLIFLWLDNPDPATLDEPRQRRGGVGLPFRQRMTASLKAMSEPKLVIIAMVQFLLNFLHSMISTFFPLYALGIGLTLSEIGLLKSVHSLVNTVARPVAATPIKWIGATRASIVGLGLMGLLDALLPVQTLTWAFAILLATIGLIRAIVLVGNTVELASIDESRISRGLASSLYSSSQDIGSLTSPALCGWLASIIGLTSMMTVVPLAAAGLFYAAVVWQNRRAQRAPVIAAG